MDWLINNNSLNAGPSIRVVAGVVLDRVDGVHQTLLGAVVTEADGCVQVHTSPVGDH